MISFNDGESPEQDLKRDVDGPAFLSPEERYDLAVEMSGPVPNSLSYREKIIGGKMVGFSGADTFYRFNDGEELVYERVEGEKERVALIRLKDGNKVPIDKWIETNGQV